ncbi:5-formyltetrahydrofolate cyclo-ligase, partial [Blastocladiella britannica]
IRAAKTALRKQIRAVLAAHPLDPKIAQKMASNVTALQEWKSASAVSIFLSMPHEVDTTPLVRAAFAAGKRVYIPCIVGAADLAAAFPGSPPPPPPNPAKVMAMVQLASEEDLATMPLDAWSIPTPTDPLTTRAVASSTLTGVAEPLDLVVMPGVAFDTTTGARCGYGKGFYDTWLAAHVPATVPRVAFARSCQCVASVPLEPHDL